MSETIEEALARIRAQQGGESGLLVPHEPEPAMPKEIDTFGPAAMRLPPSTIMQKGDIFGPGQRRRAMA